MNGCNKVKISLIGLNSKVGEDMKSADEISINFNKKPESVTINGVTKLYYFSKKEDLVRLACYITEYLIDRLGVDRLKIRGVFGSSTYTSKFLVPSFAVSYAHELGLRNIICDQIGLGCSGGLQALRNCCNQAAIDFMGNKIGYYLVAVGDQTSRILDHENYGTSVLFSDGIAVLLLSNNPEEISGYKVDMVRTKSLLNESVYSLRIKNPYHSLNKRNEIPKLKMNGPDIFKFAVKSFLEILDLVELKELDDKIYFIPHQANIRIINQIIEKNKLNPKNVYSDGIKTIGNTSGASVFFGLIDSLKRNLFDKRSNVLLGVFGAELQIGAALLSPMEKELLI